MLRSTTFYFDEGHTLYMTDGETLYLDSKRNTVCLTCNLLLSLYKEGRSISFQRLKFFQCCGNVDMGGTGSEFKETCSERGLSKIVSVWSGFIR